MVPTKIPSKHKALDMPLLFQNLFVNIPIIIWYSINSMDSFIWKGMLYTCKRKKQRGCRNKACALFDRRITFHLPISTGTGLGHPGYLGHILSGSSTIQRKILARKNFGKFGNLLQFCQSFIRQLLVISEKARGWA